MKSLMTFVGILAFNFAPLASASEFSCPVAPAFSNHTCAGTVRVQNLEQLNAYKNTLGVTASKPNVAKGLLIDFSPVLSEDLNISTPCMIKTAPNITITTTGNVCLNGKRKILLDEGFHFSGKNLNLESTEDIVVNKYSVISAQDIKLLSKGSEEINQAFFREGAQITAANILIETHNVGFIGRNSNLQLTGALAIHALGDEEASIRQGTTVIANKIDVNSTGVTRIANLTTLTASEITLIGAQGCEISKGSVMTATDRIGNCFLASLTKESFSIDKNRGTNPLTISFNGSTITDAKGFIWDFGDGQTLNTLTPTTTHTYSAVGSFTASLKYATKENYKGLKSAGSVQIDVKAAPVVPTIPPRGYFTHTQDGTFVYLRAFITRTQFNIASAYYVIDDNQNNKIPMTDFYHNSQASVEMNTYGMHKVTMYVEDTSGQKYNTSMNIWLYDVEEQMAPVIRFYGEQSAVRTIFINMYRSYIPHEDENLKEFTVDFGDGNIEHVENAASITHEYAQAGTYQVKVSAEYNGNVRSLTQPIAVTDINKPILNPIAGFYYYILEYSGNVVLTDDRSSTPNGEIISYEWNFGNGIVAYGQQASHFFEPGDHLVTLTVTDIAGLRSSQTQKIHVQEEGDSLVVAIGYADAFNKTLELEFFALDSANQISRVKLDWGDGNSQIYTEAEIPAWGLFADEHTYQNYGTYNVKLTVDTTRGESRTVNITKTLTNPVTLFPPHASLQCFMNNLIASCNSFGSYDSQGNPLIFSFDYGDGNEESSINGLSNHTYSFPGTYNITLKVTNSMGLSTTVSSPVLATVPINIAPIADGFCNSYSPETITCTDNSYDPDNSGPISIKWSVDNQSSSNIFSTFKLNSSGIKTVYLEVTDFKGIKSSKSFSVVVTENIGPVAVASCNIIDQKVLKCISNSTDMDGLIAKTKWVLSNGLIYIGDNFEVEILNENEINYTLTVTDELGKQNSINNSVAFNVDPSNINIVDNCPITNSLKNKTCADEYFQANSIDDIAEYLNNGKFNLDGDLLNIQINSSIVTNSFKLSTPCKVRVAGNIKIENSITNTCIRASGIDIVDGDININSTKPSYVFSENNITLSDANIIADNEIVLKSFNKDFFLGAINILNSSHLGASKIDISSLFLDLSETSSLDSDLVAIDGNDCSEKATLMSEKCNQNNMSRLHEIEFHQTVSSLKIDLSIANLENELVRWSIDNHEFPSTGSSFSYEPKMPGIYKAEAVIQNQDGNFRKISKLINVELRKTYKYKTQAFKFYNAQNSPDTIEAFLNNESIQLQKSKIDPEVYVAKIVSTPGMGQHITVLSQGYSSAFTVEEVQIAADPGVSLDETIAQYSQIDQELDTSLAELNSSLDSTIEELKVIFNNYSLEEKIEFITILKANLQNPSSGSIVELRKLKKVNIYSDLVVSTANANDEDLEFADRFIAINMKDYLASDIIARGAGITLTLSGLMITVQEPSQLGKTVGMMLGVFGIKILLKEHNRRANIINNIYALNDDNISIDTLNSDSSFSFSISANLDPVNDGLSSTSKTLYKVITENRAFNLLVKKINRAVGVSNSLFSIFSDKLYVKPIPFLAFPNLGTQGELDPEFIKDVSISSFTYSGAKIESMEVEDGEIKLDINSFRSQSVVLQFHYVNPELDIDKLISKNVTLPGVVSHLSYKNGNRDVEFSLFGHDNNVVSYEGTLNFKWEYGDGEVNITNSPINLHRYEDVGTYNVKLTVFDSDFNEIFSQTVSILIADISSFSYAGDREVLATYLTPYSGYSGYIYRANLEGHGICYSNGIIAAESTGIPNYGWLPWYNCSDRNLIP